MNRYGLLCMAVDCAHNTGYCLFSNKMLPIASYYFEVYFASLFINFCYPLLLLSMLYNTSLANLGDRVNGSCLAWLRLCSFPPAGLCRYIWDTYHLPSATVPFKVARQQPPFPVGQIC